MDREIRHAALRAAAKLVFFSVTLGCGSTGLIESGSDDVRQRTQNSGPSTPGSEAGGYESGATKPTDDASYTNATDAHATNDSQTVDTGIAHELSDEDCLSTIKELFADPSGDHHNFDAGNPHVTAASACCDRFLRQAWGNGGTVDWEVKGVRTECCTLEKWDSQTYPACTPWGPPVPPSMADRFALGVG